MTNNWNIVINLLYEEKKKNEKKYESSFIGLKFLIFIK